MIIVTGAAGFIGSCIVSQLNSFGHDSLILVDHIRGDHENLDLKRKNLENKHHLKYYEKDEFIKMIREDRIKGDIDCVIHMGACSSTTLQDEKYFLENNFQYSCDLAEWSLNQGARFIYASSAATYGDGSIGYKDDVETIKKCKPLNLYGESKQKFDEWVLEKGLLDKVVGLKFFNVFGPNEYHKGDMRSVVAKSFVKVRDEKKIKLFKSNHPDYQDGEQKRDFIYVKDVVDVVMFFVDHPEINGIFNVGTGQARSWNDLAKALFQALDIPLNIEYIEMPDVLKDKYQNFTEANMMQLRDAGYQKPFNSLEDTVADYVKYLEETKYF